MTEVLKILSDTSIRPTLAVWRSYARGWRDVGYGLLHLLIFIYLVVLLKTRQLPKYHHMILNQMEMIDVEVLQ